MAKRLVVVGTYLLLSLAVLGSCSSAEQAILITARAAGTNPTMIDTVVVVVIPTASTASPVDSNSNPVHRTIQDINGDQPIRIALHLHDASPVMVHITAITASGSTMLYATRCYMPNGVINDEVLLVPLDPADDADGDGWPAGPNVDAECRDPGAGATGVACDIGLCPSTTAGDCNDTPSATTPVDCSMVAFQSTGPCIYPGAAAVCGDGIDQDCRYNGLPGGSQDEPCEDMDGDGYDACGPAGGVCDCNDSNPNIHPGAVDICGNGIDEDCSGEPGGMGAYCDADMDGYPSNVDCNDNDPNIHPGPLSLEHCDSTPTAGMCMAACTLVAGSCVCDGVDNNCNGLVDEDASCRSPDLDGDGSDACAAGVTDCASCDCNDCDSGIHPGAHSVCGNMIDEDGVGGDPHTTGDPMCDPADTDHDGYSGGQDCGEGDPHVHLDAAENCMTTVSESCGTMSCPATVDVDVDGFQAATASGTDCNDANAMINAWATEICNGVDDNCNGESDEVLDPTNQIGCVTDPMCTMGSRCTVTFATSIHHCGGCRQECNPGTTLVADQCAGGVCQCTTNAGSAACAVGSTCCGTMDGMGNPVAHPGCFDTDTATQNCGGCGNVCDANTADSCVGGHCVCGSTGAACGTGQTCCGGACVNLATDATHCGRCDRACGTQHTTCTAGACGCDNPTQRGDCDNDIGMSGNGCESDLQGDATHCGTCAQSCLDEHVASGSCSAGACVIGSCTSPYGDCTGGGTNGCETDLSTTSNCGGCGTTCNPAHATPACMAAGTTFACGYGMCTAACDVNGIRSDGCEVAVSPTTCGAMCSTNCQSTVVNVPIGNITCGGAACSYTGACSAGACDTNGNRTDGCEVTQSPTTCGGTCSTNCNTAVHNVPAGTATCSGGACGYSGGCSAGACDVNGNMTDGCEVTQSATTCGASCSTNCNTAVHGVPAGSATCSGGTCGYSGGCSAGACDANGNMTDGCEVMQTTTTCGASCNTNCTTMVNGVPAGNVTCSGGACGYSGACSAGMCDVNGSHADGCEVTQSVTACGASCATNCQMTVVNVPMANITCTTGACTYSGACSTGYLDCDSMRSTGCEQMEDATHCGPTCTDCTGLANVMAATCTSGVCVITTCSGTHANCNGTVSDGCESTHGTNTNCCGADCTTMSAGMMTCDSGANGTPACGP